MYVNNLGLGYIQLNPDEKLAYTILLEALNRQQSFCDVSKVKKSVNLMRVLTTVIGDNPYIIYFDKTMIRTMEGLFRKQLDFVGCLEKRQAEQLNIELKKALEDVVWEIDKNAKDDKEILLGISEYLQRTTTYDNEELHYMMYGRSKNLMSHNPYGVLVKHKAVCDGFSSAYSLIAQYFGFKCMIVEGKSSYHRNAKVKHAWNIIEYNGEYFHIDSTWDVNTYEVIKEYSYDYFGLDDDEISIDHDWDFRITPKCKSSKLSYFKIKNLLANSEAQIEEIIYRCMKRNEAVIRLKVSPTVFLKNNAEQFLKDNIIKAASRLGIYKSFEYVWQENTRCLMIKIE